MSEDFTESIDKIYQSIHTLMKGRKCFTDAKGVKHDFDDHEYVSELYNMLYKLVYRQVYEVLAPEKTSRAEKSMRILIARYVTGYADEKKIRWDGVLEPLKARIAKLSKSRYHHKELIAKFVSLYDDFMAVAAFRSLKHFVLYLEMDYERKIWSETEDLFDGLWFYANKMVDGEVKFIEKRLPTGYGKSHSDNFIISYIFGRNYNDNVIKVFGSKYNCVPCLDAIINIMCSKRFAKVFPYYAQFGGKPDLIFEMCKKTDGQLKIRGSSCPVNLLVVGKKSEISGTRAKYIFLDDITQAEDAGNIRAHEEDIRLYNSVWIQRTYGKDNMHVVASGTSYSTFDILTYLAKKFGFDESVPSKSFKYTKIAVSDAIVPDGKSVFVTVPKLDENDKSTYEKMYPTARALKERAEDYERFMAMDQQEPIAPKENPFYYTNLLEYECLPKIGTEGRTEAHWASLDPKRSGRDNLAMPILSEVRKKHYLVDFLYESRPMKDCYGLIVAKIIQHKITRLYIENNTDTSLKQLLLKMLDERGITFCVIEETYQTIQKDKRISDAEGDIKANIVFPKFGMYAKSSQMGKALQDMYTYSYFRKNEHEDSLDALAMYSKKFISRGAKTPEVEIIKGFWKKC